MPLLFSVGLWCELNYALPPLSNSYVKSLIPTETVFGNRVF